MTIPRTTRGLRAFTILFSMGALPVAHAQTTGEVFDAERNAYATDVARPVKPIPGTVMLKDLDSLCSPQTGNRFWSIDANSVIRQWAISGGAVLGGDTVMQASGFNSLAYCAVNGANTFYSGSSGAIPYFTGGSWTYLPVTGSPINVGGAGSYLYYLGGGNTTLHFFDGANALLIATAPIQFTIADVAVALDGSAYLLSGTSIYNATSVEVYASDGSSLASYPITMNPLNAYGSFMMGSTMYVGLGNANTVTPDVLQPITFAGGVATFGTTIPFPENGVQFYDLASCNPATPTHLGPPVALAADALTAFPVPADDALHVQLPAAMWKNVVAVELFDATGREVVITWRNGGDGTMETTGIDHLRDGAYRLQVRTAQGDLRSTGVIVRHAE